MRTLTASTTSRSGASAPVDSTESGGREEEEGERDKKETIYSPVPLTQQVVGESGTQFRSPQRITGEVGPSSIHPSEMLEKVEPSSIHPSEMLEKVEPSSIHPSEMLEKVEPSSIHSSELLEKVEPSKLCSHIKWSLTRDSLTQSLRSS